MDCALHTANILLPRAGTDLTKWAVVACDQFTAQPEYWREVRAIVGDAPSTLNFILPEAFLNEGDERIPAIHAAMRLGYAHEHPLRPNGKRQGVHHPAHQPHHG